MLLLGAIIRTSRHPGGREQSTSGPNVGEGKMQTNAKPRGIWASSFFRASKVFSCAVSTDSLLFRQQEVDL